MPLCSDEPEYKKAKENLAEAIKEFAKVTENNGSLIIGSTVVFEVTLYDDDGVQNYAIRHIIMDPGSLIHAAGLLTVAKSRLVDYMNDLSSSNQED